MWDISQILNSFPQAGLLLLLVLGALGLPFPEDMTLLLCGFLIGNDVIKPLPVLLTVYGVMLAIDCSFFFLGRKYGPGIVSRRTFRKILSTGRLSQLESKFKKWGILFIVLGRHIVVLRTQLILATGVFRMQPVKFLIADAVTIPVTMLIMIGLGYVGGSSLQIVKKDITRIEHITLLVVLLPVAVSILYRFFKGRRLL